MLAFVTLAWLFLCVVSALVIPPKRSTIVIGGTGTVGLEVVKQLNIDPANDWMSSFMQHEITGKNILVSMKKGSVFELDLQQSQGLQIPTFPGCGSRPTHFMLINCAGVCLTGSTEDVMRRSLQVNTIGPIMLAKLAIQKFAEARTSEDALSIVNVSSGEGELSFLHTRIAAQVSAIQSLSECDQYVEELLRTFESSTEYAHGGTPMYSLSKALLNKYTQLLHQQHHLDKQIRVLACCPGNVASPMSTQEELETAVPARYAAEHICRLATGFLTFPGGKFYRDCREISW